ncbi:inter-alpha-trypsin inhibitor heavy chain H5-like isoform X2 [Corticium candelabrum]|uniref:inter-alpha-trypsin inhibitor heavy chain H5-like isoform X2 n=1 Tax=Corticium candelabrum TaxID=121492 RepID=UPI002E25DA5E|nr:inter-alpha-trypsin inhibitor heavy chain H5-like isoform X2 [Corticium candelabrum]
MCGIPTAEDAGVYKCTPTVLQIPSSEIDKYIGYTVVKEADACAGDDPRFSIPLGNGNMLCFSVDGKGGDIFNLISDTHLSVNVKYIDGTDGYSVWMGELAFVLDNGCKVRVNADPESVQVDNTVVDKKFYDEDVQVDVYAGDYVAVKFRKLQVEFRAEFIDRHLSFYVVNDKGLSPRVHGLIGQFLNSKHEIVESEDGHIFGLLKRQGRTRALVLKQKRWPYLRGHKEASCWGIQGKNPKGAIDWSHSSYKMMSLCQTKRRILTRPLFGAVDKTF